MAARPGASILWRRLDVPGHDAALLTNGTTKVELRGMAVFRDEDGPSAWLEWPAKMLQPLVQRHDRQSATTYHYESDLPTGDTFTSLLHVDSFGWVLSYGGLWEAEAAV
jgi:hypothetical protein